MMLNNEIQEVETAVEVFSKDCKCEIAFDRAKSHHGALVISVKGVSRTFDDVNDFVCFMMGFGA